MLSVLEIIQKTAGFLEGKGVESPRLNAELLIGHALELKRMQLYLQFERLLTEAELEKIRPLVRRRASREPLQYIVGYTEFHGLRLKVDRRALIPRPETEGLVEIAIGLTSEAPARVLDLGTGTGAIAIALASAFPSAEVVAVDVSDEALALAAENVTRTGMDGRVKLLRSHWFDSLEQGSRFDLVIGNPPYLSSAETAETSPEVRDHEPIGALTAEAEGLNDLRAIITAAPKYLTANGLLALETGIHQHTELVTLARSNGLHRVESRQDLTRRDRYLFAWA